jgi:hypothetical protein
MNQKKDLFPFQYRSLLSYTCSFIHSFFLHSKFDVRRSMFDVQILGSVGKAIDSESFFTDQTGWSVEPAAGVGLWPLASD